MVCIAGCVRSIKSLAISIGLHMGVLALGFLVGSRGIFPPAPERPLQRPKPLYFSPHRLCPRLAVLRRCKCGPNTSSTRDTAAQVESLLHSA